MFHWLTVPAAAQDRRWVVFGDIGRAEIRQAESTLGPTRFFGGGAGVHLSPRLVIELDVHTARLNEPVFFFDRGVERTVTDRFVERTVTLSLLFRASPQRKVHFVAGGGLGWYREHAKAEWPPPVARLDRVETLPLLHGRVGADWDFWSDRLVLRTHGVVWMHGGLPQVFGVRVGVGYRF